MFSYIYLLQIVQAATSFYKKLLAADKYVPSTKVSCDVTLVKPTENYAKLEEDYGLNEVNFPKTFLSKPINY